jgi:hypothetical protein
MLFPELLAMIASDLFLLLSLLTCLLEERFPKALPYVYQIAGIMGFGHLAVSRVFFTVFDEPTRFWYNSFYLGVALTNIVAVNLYLAVWKKSWNMAKAWSAAVTFPSIFLSIILAYSYCYSQEATMPPYFLPLVLALSVGILGTAVAFLLKMRIQETRIRR